ncbi:MAG TPA: DUF3601 domain-containing protein [Cyclobacteriaceae bacterium]|nr:DUF3601 domain-containing protein [Cyclobacteriaceae bacterium]
MPSLTELTAGQSIQVVTTFTDFDGQEIKAGTRLTFLSYSYFPYDEGYTFKFNEGDIRLAGIDRKNEEVLNQFGRYFKIL